MASSLQGIVSRFLAASLTTALVLGPRPALAANAAVVQDSEIERLYIEGQERYGNDDFSGAAESWSRLLEKLPEAQANKATRENVLLNITQAYLDAYNRSRADDGSKDIEHLRKGKKVLETYFAGYRKAYGDRAGVSAAVQEKSDELDAELRKAEEDAARKAAAAGQPDPGDPTTATGPGTTPPDDTQPKVIVLKPQNTGNGLIVGGSVLAFLGVGALTMGIIGAVRVPKAEEDFTQAKEDGDTLAQDEATFRGEQGQKLAIAGFVLAPLLLGGAAAMIYFGVTKKRAAQANAERAVSVAPVFGPRFGGLGVSGRF